MMKEKFTPKLRELPFRIPLTALISCLLIQVREGPLGKHSTVFSGFWYLWDCGPFGKGA